MEKFVRNLKSLYKKLRLKKKLNWNRDLPFCELCFDRWERAKNLGFGLGTSIYHNSYVYGDVEVGKNTWIGPFTILDGSGGLKIGSNCSISAGVQIYTHDTVEWALHKGPQEREGTSIGDNCYIGPNAVICKGVKICNKCVVGANSLVNKDIKSGERVYGNPARASDEV